MQAVKRLYTTLPKKVNATAPGRDNISWPAVSGTRARGDPTQPRPRKQRPHISGWFVKG